MNQAIIEAFPLQAVPAFGGIPRADKSGMRYLVAKHGVWREIQLPWIRHQSLIAPCATGFEMPYGKADNTTQVLCNPVNIALLKQFHDNARAEKNREIAAALVWNEHTGLWRYAPRETIFSNDSYVKYREVEIQEGEHLVVDMHSHGLHPAFFSLTDDADDHGAMRFSLVLGSLGQPIPSSAMRLCMAGEFLDAGIDDSGALEVFP